ncbi:ketopantoate reductase family protein [Natranaerobius trueperi]|uniref:2-dehydropantoate 2-reductase n=1 Tax=Natranaerobius trueperi TaxID=759412 RepID=A0A226BWW1_9FIRM|nr:2-dehydropantoate 2-reductase [Natranaerobius trueperi]OWZ82679.1 2-dehydropantoate 2-reductase [Natranaerobius trueperi]
MKITVIGAGAMGCVFGGHLQEGGNVVTMIDIWEEHVKALNEKGLSLKGASGDRVIPISAQTDTTGMSEQDLVIVLVKASVTQKALESAKNIIGPETIVLTVQNGIGNAENIAEVIDVEKIIVGTTANASELTKPGEVIHHGQGETVIGKYEGKLTDRDKKIAEEFKNCKLEAKAVDNIMSIVWSKLILNTAVNGLSGVLQVPLGKLYEWPETREFMRDIITETEKVANAKGIEILHDDPYEKVFTICRDKAPGHYASMAQDVYWQRKTEIDVINGTIVEEGKANGIETPANTAIVRMVKGVEKGYLKGKKSDY